VTIATIANRRSLTSTRSSVLDVLRGVAQRRRHPHIEGAFAREQVVPHRPLSRRQNLGLRDALRAQFVLLHQAVELELALETVIPPQQNARRRRRRRILGVAFSTL
jgi:hypothetical protein